MISYSDRYGKHKNFEDAKSLQDLQKLCNLRKRVLQLTKWVDIIHL